MSTIVITRGCEWELFGAMLCALNSFFLQPLHDFFIAPFVGSADFKGAGEVLGGFVTSAHCPFMHGAWTLGGYCLRLDLCEYGGY